MQLEKLQNRAARIVTNRSFDAPRIPLIKSLGLKVIDERISDESKLIVFKFCKPPYLRNLFTRNFDSVSLNLRNTASNPKVTKENVMGTCETYIRETMGHGKD